MALISERQIILFLTFRNFFFVNTHTAASEINVLLTDTQLHVVVKVGTSIMLECSMRICV
jgi:hypothetical protein